MTEFGVVGIGPLAGTVVQSIYGLGFDNVMLIGDSEIEKIDIPADRRLVFDDAAPKSMLEAEQWAALNAQKIFARMEERLGLPDRIFVVAAGDGTWAGATLVLVECGLYLLKKAGHTSNQRIGVLVALPTSTELKTAQQAKDLKFLIDHLVESNVVRRHVDPLLVGDRTNICGIFDAIAAPSPEEEDVIEEQEPEEAPAAPPPSPRAVVREVDDLYGE